MKKLFLFGLIFLAGSVFAENVGELGVAGTGIEGLMGAALGFVAIIIGILVFVYVKSKV